MKRLLYLCLALTLLVSAFPTALAAPDWVADYFEGRAVFCENGKYGFLDEDGNIVVQAIYDSARPYQNGYARVSRWEGQQEKYGLLDLEGREVLPLEYAWIGEPSEGLRPVYPENRRGGYLDDDLQLVITCQYSETGDFTNGYACVAVDDENGRPLRGAIDAAGRVVVPTAYLGVDVERWRDKGLALVQSWEEAYGAVSLETAEEVWPCEYNSIAALTAAMEAGGHDPDLLWKRVKAAGEAAGLQVDWYPEYETITRLSGLDRMALKQNGLFGLFTLEGEPVTGCVFDAIDQPLRDGTMVAMKNGKWGRIDQNGGTVEDFIHPTKEEAEHPVNVQILQKGGLFAIADKSGKLLTGYDYWNAKSFVNGYAALQNSQGLWGYIDGDGGVAVPFRYRAVEYNIGSMSGDGVAVVQVYSSGYYLVSASGQQLLGPVALAWPAGQGLYGFVQNDKVGFVGRQGDVVIEPRYSYRMTPKGPDYGGIFNENGVAMVYTGEQGETMVCIDATGAEVAKDAVSAAAGNGALRKEYENGYWGFCDDGGEIVVPCIYDAVSDFDRGYASVRADGVYGMLKTPVHCSEQAGEKLVDRLSWAMAEAGTEFTKAIRQALLLVWRSTR